MVTRTGNNGTNTLTGSADDDFIDGKGGDDFLYGRAGDDTIHGGNGNDLIWGQEGKDQIFGEGGDDTIVMYSGGDVISGGSGMDMLDFFYASAGLTIDLTQSSVNFKVKGKSVTSTYSSIEGAWGSAFGDTVNGNGKDNVLLSMEGNDTVHGGGGDDVINAYKGNDKVFGDAGNDRVLLAPGRDNLDGGAGRDILDLFFSKFGATLSLEEGTISFTQIDGKGTSTFQNFESIWGSEFKDKLTGDDKQNFIWGRDGDDRIFGHGGNDVLEGALGNDTLVGGAGRDAFYFSVKPSAENFDKVLDFQEDVDFLAFDTGNIPLKAKGPTHHLGDFTYRQLDPSQFQSSAGHVAATADVRIIYDESNGLLYYDANGSKAGQLAVIANLGKNLDIDADTLILI